MFQCDDATEASSMISLRFVVSYFHLSCWFFTTIPSDWDLYSVFFSPHSLGLQKMLCLSVLLFSFPLDEGTKNLNWAFIVLTSPPVAYVCTAALKLPALPHLSDLFCLLMPCIQNVSQNIGLNKCHICTLYLNPLRINHVYNS